MADDAGSPTRTLDIHGIYRLLPHRPPFLMVDRIKDIIHFHYYFAYSVGIAFPPTWLESEAFGIKLDNHRPLEEGMVFHFPMTLRIKGEFGIGQSQTVIVTRDGCEVLSTLPLGLQQVGS